MPSKKTIKQRVHDIDSLLNTPLAAGTGQSESTADPSQTARICGRLVDLDRSAAIQASIAEWNRSPKDQRETLTALAHRLDVSREYCYKILRKLAKSPLPLSTQSSRPVITQPVISKTPTSVALQEIENVNFAAVDKTPENRPRHSARAVIRNQTLIEAGKLTRFRPGEIHNAGGRPKSYWQKPITKKYMEYMNKLIPGDEAGRTYLEAMVEGQFLAAAQGKPEPAKEITNRIEGRVPHSEEGERAWYSLIIDASEVPAGFVPVKQPAELPAPMDGDQEQRAESTELRAPRSSKNQLRGFTLGLGFPFPAREVRCGRGGAGLSTVGTFTGAVDR